MAGRWLFHPLPLRERVGRGVAPVSSTLQTRRLVVPSPPHPNPLPRRERVARSPFGQGCYCYFNGIGLKRQSGRLNSAFLGLFSTIYGSSVQYIDTQLDALPILPVLARGVSGCLNSAFSQQISTFYGSYVQLMDAQLGARHRWRTLTIHRGRGQRTIALRPTVVSR